MADGCCPGDGGGGGGGGGGDPPPPPPLPCLCCPQAAGSGAEGSVSSAYGTTAIADCCEPPYACDDGNPCTENDLCENPEVPNCGPTTCCGTPKVCDDGNPCTYDGCEGGECIFTPKVCNDGLLCTIDSCNPGNGQCVFQPKTCDDQEVCTADSCNPQTGECTNTPNCQDPAQPQCCADGTESYCCTSSNGLCCTNPNRCCAECQTCCEAGCCGPWQICCNGQCCGGTCLTASCVDDQCVTSPACDDDNPCTEDICTPGLCGAYTCDNPPWDVCVTCEQGSVSAEVMVVATGQPGWCEGGACIPEACEISVTSGEACPGGTAELLVSGDCSPECINSMSWEITSQSPHLTGSSGGLVCAGKSLVGLVSVSPEAPLGPIPITITGNTPGGAQCIHDATISVTLGVVLTLNPTFIPATTAWPGMPDYSYSEVTVEWNPPFCEGQLEIVEIQPLGGYVPPNAGTLTRINANLWRYDAFDELQSELCPKNVKVWIAAKSGETELDRQSVLVLPVHDWWMSQSQHQHGPAGTPHSRTPVDFANDYDFIRWKYAAVLATTGGTFTPPVTISTDSRVHCGLPWPLGTDGYACTNVGTGNVIFATSTFTGSENQAASIIGHELIHASGVFSECPPYTWEFNNDAATGVFQCDIAYLAEVVGKLNCACNNICPPQPP